MNHPNRSKNIYQRIVEALDAAPTRLTVTEIADAVGATPRATKYALRNFERWPDGTDVVAHQHNRGDSNEPVYFSVDRP